MTDDLFDYEVGARYRHNKTGVVFTLTEIKPGTATIQADGQSAIKIPPRVLDNLYSIVEPPEPPDPVGILPIGSVAIEYDGPTPPPALGSITDELAFKRSGRPRVERPSIDSYFGEPRKLGPRRKTDK